MESAHLLGGPGQVDAIWDGQDTDSCVPDAHGREAPTHHRMQAPVIHRAGVRWGKDRPLQEQEEAAELGKA